MGKEEEMRIAISLLEVERENDIQCIYTYINSLFVCEGIPFHFSGEEL